MTVQLISIEEFEKYKEQYKMCMSCGAINRKDNELCYNCEHNSFHPVSDNLIEGMIESINVLGEWEVTIG